MNDAHQYTVVVGVDGSPASKAALRWAAWHARQLNGTIIAVTAWDVPMIYNWEVPESGEIATRTAQGLDGIVTEVLGDSEVTVSKEVSSGHPARAVLDAAEEAGADLIVMGNRGRGGFTKVLLGSVSQHVLHHARCPVLVIRDEQD